MPTFPPGLPGLCVLPLAVNCRSPRSVSRIVLTLLTFACTAPRCQAQSLTGLSLNPTTVVSGGQTTGTVTLSAAAPAGGLAVCLNYTTAPNVTVALPVYVTVPQGSSSANFTATGTATTTTTVNLIASLSTANVTAGLTITGSGGGGGGGGGGGQYLYEVIDTPVNVTPSGVALTDIYLPPTMKVSWISAFTGPTTYQVQRNGVTLGTTSSTSWTDSFSFSGGTTYTYGVSVVNGHDELGLPSPPQGADPNTIAHLRYQSTQSPYATINVTPYQITASDNQTVDSRYDPRYSTYTYINYQFGNNIYRGGLFAGYNADNSNVARSFLKYSLPTIPQGQYVWLAGTVNAYFTRCPSSQSITVRCQNVATSWTQSTITWSNAPAVTPSAATQTVVISDNGQGSAAGWYRWNALPDIIGHLWTDAILSECLASTSEGSSAWGYFAKKEYSSAEAPTVLLAYGDQLVLYSVTVSPNPVHGGSPATGTIQLNGPAPAGGLACSVQTSNSQAAMVAACQVVIPAGQASATFPITTYAVGSNTNVTISVGCVNQLGVSCTLTVTH